MKHLLFTALATLTAITSFAQEKPVEADKNVVNTVYYINFIKVNKSAVDKLPASRIASMKVVKGKVAKPGPDAGENDVVVYILTKEYASKQPNNKPATGE